MNTYIRKFGHCILLTGHFSAYSFHDARINPDLHILGVTPLASNHKKVNSN